MDVVLVAWFGKGGEGWVDARRGSCCVHRWAGGREHSSVLREVLSLPSYLTTDPAADSVQCDEGRCRALE